MNDTEFWKTEGINEYRFSNKVFHEGEEIIQKIVEYVGKKTIRDVGCGYGRLANLFDKDLYIGYDINSSAIKKANRMFPNYRFVYWNYEKLCDSEVTLLANVLWCINPNDFDNVFDIVTENTNIIVMAEVIDPIFFGSDRPKHDHNVFPRKLEEYDLIFKNKKFLRDSIYVGKHEYLKYQYVVVKWIRSI